MQSRLQEDFRALTPLKAEVRNNTKKAVLQNANYRKQMGRRTRGTTKICHAVICALWDCFFA